ncbi:glycosyltransferase family 2 protein [Sinomonas gamaensis]|uniref:glycosyltransferase family 2 protein n=1 Tax=Sinomonas gamaensis TaxID=2565624 RepID=UPI001108B979|nr:glycosyltransferase family 2 protein [Sinomonas gamaensis]
MRSRASRRADKKLVWGAGPSIERETALSVAAVIVSYNRKELLRRCLTSVAAQVPAPDEIIVVDNGSTDGSVELVRSEFPSATLFETGSNIGGAGGFAWGVELAISKGHEYAWLMDDDAEPAPDSLAPLLEVAAHADVAPGFLASAVKDEDGDELNPGHLPAVDPSPEKQLRARALGCIAITHATFVGVLVNLRMAATMPLPHRDFFIWLDDAEYTRRLARRSVGLFVPESVVKHPVKAANPDMAGRLFYYVRNHLWLTKLDTEATGLAGSVSAKAADLVRFAATILPASRSKKLWLTSLSRGLWQGLTTSPKPVMPGELLASKE